MRKRNALVLVALGFLAVSQMMTMKNEPNKPNFDGFTMHKKQQTYVFVDPSTDVLTYWTAARSLLVHVKDIVPVAFKTYNDANFVCVQKNGTKQDAWGNDAGTAVLDVMCFTRETNKRINWENISDSSLAKVADSKWQAIPTGWGS